MTEIDFITSLHTSTQRDYLARVNAHDKAACSEIACQFGEEYWDGPRHLGYGGYRYDGRWRSVAQAMVDHYALPDDAKILDVGCGKGFLLYEFTQVLPDCTVTGLDVSDYAIAHAKPEIQSAITPGHANTLPYPDDHFDLVYSINALHNLLLPDLFSAVHEMQRVSHRAKHIVVEAYRNEREKMNLMYWQLTCRAFHTPDEWRWLYEQCGYDGDYSFIYFE